MNSYRWYGKNSNGHFIHGEINAFSYKLAKFYLQQQGLKYNFLYRKIRFYKPYQSISMLDMALFFRQLTTLLTSGIPIIQACTLLAKLQKNIILKNVINTLTKEIEAGKKLSTCLQQFPHYFDNFTCYLIELGEQTGSLDKILIKISTIKEKAHANKKTIQKALVYPGLTCFIGFVILVFILTFIIPRFQDLFISTHTSLPLITRFIFYLSHILLHYYYLFLIFFIILFCGLIYLKQFISICFGKYYFYLPFIKVTYHKILLSRFTMSLAATFSAGLPIVESLSIIAYTVNNSTFQKEILYLQNQITLGKSLYTAMEQQKFFPELMVSLIKIGEETGKLDLMLEKVNSIYESDINDTLNHFNTLLEPLIILILGVLIGGVVIAMYLPIFKLGTVI